MIRLATFPVTSRERAQIRLTQAVVEHQNVYPRRILLGPVDYKNLRRNMENRHGFLGKPLQVLNVPIVEGDVPLGQIGFEWEDEP